MTDLQILIAVAKLDILMTSLWHFAQTIAPYIFILAVGLFTIRRKETTDE